MRSSGETRLHKLFKTLDAPQKDAAEDVADAATSAELRAQGVDLAKLELQRLERLRRIESEAAREKSHARRKEY